jgi:hypothetical protein
MMRQMIETALDGSGSKRRRIHKLGSPVELLKGEAYNTEMTDATQSAEAANGWQDHAFDLTRGIAAYTKSGLVGRIARVIADHPEAEITVAFNHKQVASKMWARDRLLEALGGQFSKIWILGGWYGVLAAMLFDDSRFDIDLIQSIDLDAEVAAVAKTLNHDAGPRFEALTGDMYELDYLGGKPDLVVNTSCEHIADVRAWLDRLAPGTKVLLQSNDYFAEPTHINCFESVEAFAHEAALSTVNFSGSLPTKKYNRFMLIGTV